MNYSEITNSLNELSLNLPTKIIGRSLLGEEVHSFHVGNFKGPSLLLTGGIHAREYISTLYLMEVAKYLSQQDLIGGVYIIPLLNPDGVRMVLDGVEFINDPKLKRFLIDVNDGEDFSLYKANANGVDLNVNFDAKWGEGKKNQKQLCRENFIGYYKNSEIENINIINFMKTIKFDAHLAFHSKGEVIYYGFNKRGDRFNVERAFVKSLSKQNKYRIIKTKKSTGGLSDYVSDTYRVPSATIELGRNVLTHPIMEDKLSEIFEKNKTIPETALAFLSKI